jgi:hypothetical protein
MFEGEGKGDKMRAKELEGIKNELKKMSKSMHK